MKAETAQKLRETYAQWLAARQIAYNEVADEIIPKVISDESPALYILHRKVVSILDEEQSK